MQFLEHSIIGLRAARHVLTRPTPKQQVTLFPVIHLGDPKFYETVHAAAATHDTVLVEGVASKTVRHLTRAYRWAAPERLGLVVQPKFTSDRTRVIHADLPGPEFDALWRGAPWAERALLEVGAALMGLWLRGTATRHSLGRGLCTNDLKDRDDLLIWSPRRASILAALQDARDAALCSKITELLREDPAPASIAVIYGAAHMRAVTRALDREGFVVSDSEWITVFET